MYHLLQFWCWFCEEFIVELVFILAYVDHKGTTTSYLYSRKCKCLIIKLFSLHQYHRRYYTYYYYILNYILYCIILITTVAMIKLKLCGTQNH